MDKASWTLLAPEVAGSKDLCSIAPQVHLRSVADPGHELCNQLCALEYRGLTSFYHRPWRLSILYMGLLVRCDFPAHHLRCHRRDCVSYALCFRYVCCLKLRIADAQNRY